MIKAFSPSRFWETRLLFWPKSSYLEANIKTACFAFLQECAKSRGTRGSPGFFSKLVLVVHSRGQTREFNSWVISWVKLLRQK